MKNENPVTEKDANPFSNHDSSKMYFSGMAPLN